MVSTFEVFAYFMATFPTIEIHLLAFLGNNEFIKLPIKMKKIKIMLCLLVMVSIRFTGFSQDTLRLTLPQAEQRFLQKNFVLMAQKFNINLAEAAVSQAKLWDNPNLQLELNSYNPNTGRIFPLTNTTGDPTNPNGGGYLVQVQQMFNLAKRRSKLVALSETNIALQQAAFQDAMRILRFQLVQSFGNIYNEQQQYKMLQLESQQLVNLLVAFKARLKLGVIAEYEVTRLELEQKNLNSVLKNLSDQISQEQANLRVLLVESGQTYIQTVTETNSDKVIPTLNNLVELAYANRPDLQVMDKTMIYNKQNLTYQQALATPRLMLGLDFQKYGSVYPNFWGLQGAIDLPWKNRNQGNIQAAKIIIDQSTQTQNQVRLQIDQDVVSALQQYQHTMDLQRTLTIDYLERIKEISKNATDDYSKRIIDLVSFIDKIRAYKDAQLNIIDLNNQVFQAQQQLNFVTNSNIF